MKPKFNLPEIEQRSLVVDDLEVRAEPNDDGNIEFRGTAIHFDRKTDVYGMFKEQFRAGAFTKTIVESDIVMLQQHDPTKVLARSKRNAAGSTMQLRETGTGLRVEAQWAPTTVALDLAANMRAGNIHEMSIGFRPIREEWDESSKVPVRSVTEASLKDISVVIYPVHGGTTAAVRSAALMPALYELLGMTELDEERRSALLMQVALGGDVDEEFMPVLTAAQEHLATYTQRAGHAPPAVVAEGDAGDTSTSPPPSDVDMRRRRLWLAQHAP